MTLAGPRQDDQRNAECAARSTHIGCAGIQRSILGRRRRDHARLKADRVDERSQVWVDRVHADSGAETDQPGDSHRRRGRDHVRQERRHLSRRCLGRRKTGALVLVRRVREHKPSDAGRVLGRKHAHVEAARRVAYEHKLVINAGPLEKSSELTNHLLGRAWNPAPGRCSQDRRGRRNTHGVSRRPQAERSPTRRLLQKDRFPGSQSATRCPYTTGGGGSRRCQPVDQAVARRASRWDCTACQVAPSAIPTASSQPRPRTIRRSAPRMNPPTTGDPLPMLQYAAAAARRGGGQTVVLRLLMNVANVSRTLRPAVIAPVMPVAMPRRLDCRDGCVATRKKARLPTDASSTMRV